MMSIICIPYNISFVSLYALLLSHPTRVRGLKWEIGKKAKMIGNVAPHPGAWIEMKNSYGRDELTAGVAPHPGAWIEINSNTVIIQTDSRSHPTRVRGLKYGQVLEP